MSSFNFSLQSFGRRSAWRRR